MRCDEDCPNWKGLGICSHTVASAESLPEFIEWYKKSKRSPNLSKFVDATMPKGRGNKGSVPPRKRKSTLPAVGRCTNPSSVLSILHLRHTRVAHQQVFLPYWNHKCHHLRITFNASLAVVALRPTFSAATLRTGHMYLYPDDWPLGARI